MADNLHRQPERVVRRTELPMRLTVRHITQAEAEIPKWARYRWLIVDHEHPENVLFYRGLLGIPEGADYLIGAIATARGWERRGYQLRLAPEMKAFEAAYHGLALATRLLRARA